jgi:GPH family glycoside/pentoside/hexuronide:cation symporter
MPGDGGGLSTVRKLGLGVGDLGYNLYWQSSSLFLLYFYTDVLQLPAVIAGLIYMLALIWDAVIDPLVGLFVDRTRTRFGRYRPYFLFGAPVLGLAYVLMYAAPIFCAATPPLARDLVIVSALGHVGFRSLYALVSIPYSSLFARVTRDSRTRADLSGFRIAFAMVASLIVAGGTLPLVRLLGHGDARQGWIGLAILFAVAGTAIIWFVAWSSAGLDRVEPPAPRRPVRAVASSLLGNTPLMLIAGVVLLTSFSGVFFQKNIVYYFKYVRGDANQASFALSFMAVLTGVSVPLWAWVARTFGKRPGWIAGAALSAAGLILWRFAGAFGLIPLLGALALIAIGNSCAYVCFWAIVPDTVEYGEWRSGVRTESLVHGVISLIQKAALGFGAGGLGFALSQIGYVANRPMSSATLDGLQNLMAFVPLTGVVAGGVAMFRYRLDPRTHARMVAEIAARAA